jgi:hypothetical protein
MNNQDRNSQEVESRSPERRRFLVTSLVLGAMTALRGWISFWPSRADAASAAAQAPFNPKTPGPVAGQPPQTIVGMIGKPFRVSIRSFTVDGGSKPGEIVRAKMTVDTSGGGTKPVPWNIYRSNTVLKAETQPNVAAGAGFEAQAEWRASAGKYNFYGNVDPQNTLLETAAEQKDNVSQVVTRIFSDWPKWIDGAKQGVREAFPAWNRNAHLLHVVINGPKATEGRVEYPPNLKSSLSARMVASGAPAEVVDSFMGALAEAVQKWANSVRVPGLPWYPAFAAVPSPVAPPTPNTPTPFPALVQDLTVFAAATIAAAIKARVGEPATWPGGATGINDFCDWFAAGLSKAIAGSQVTQVLGKGPVPTFAPPYVPVGPVVGGDVTNAQPLLSVSPTWP